MYHNSADSMQQQQQHRQLQLDNNLMLSIMANIDGDGHAVFIQDDFHSLDARTYYCCCCCWCHYSGILVLNEYYDMMLRCQ